jgi:8-oxo-dGTP diphosphatase
MPKTTVAALVTRHDAAGEQILLTKRAVEPFKGLWCLPGGHFDEYERALEAVTREVREETGLDFAPQFLGYFDEIIPEMRIHAVVLAFHGAGEGEIATQQEEVADVGWFSLDEAGGLRLAFQHNEIVAAYARAAKS